MKKFILLVAVLLLLVLAACGADDTAAGADIFRAEGRPGYYYVEFPTAPVFTCVWPGAVPINPGGVVGTEYPNMVLTYRVNIADIDEAMALYADALLTRGGTSEWETVLRSRLFTNEKWAVVFGYGTFGDDIISVRLMSRDPRSLSPLAYDFPSIPNFEDIVTGAPLRGVNRRPDHLRTSYRFDNEDMAIIEDAISQYANALIEMGFQRTPSNRRDRHTLTCEIIGLRIIILIDKEPLFNLHSIWVDIVPLP